jgi:hypothetical protein
LDPGSSQKLKVKVDVSQNQDGGEHELEMEIECFIKVTRNIHCLLDRCV